MGVFRGITPLSLDAKGRLSMPVRYRQSLLDAAEGRLILTVDIDRCLLLYPLLAWEDVERKLLQLSSTHPRARALKRLLLGHAEECGMDASGRILLPGPLREFAHLDKRVVLVGQGNKFEIWDEPAWNTWREMLLAGGGDDGNEPLPDLDSLAF
ncbi:MAG: division/cell wall cluster transcriptional repressor MraZ [Candidatus Competibacteraceae bacterium]|nr:division/cell wall cluster transcriptional repressor MraZ [Candidatus Competibacteraceae bacterium]MCP5126866.1 division/cell wall cluster transcriptional repressor MraZ [Gammaproteobacteria bacterium]HRX70470.1 division/cell wall cluster transcriptional repressor MraZ [Candidatus Competibacteraceae bacterium]